MFKHRKKVDLMAHTQYLNNINDSLNIICFDHFLNIMSYCHNTYLNRVFFTELILLSHGFDLLGLNDPTQNGVYVTLSRLGIINTVYKHIDAAKVFSNYAICTLSPLGTELVTYDSDLKQISDMFFEKYDSKKYDSVRVILNPRNSVPTLADVLNDIHNDFAIYDDFSTLYEIIESDLYCETYSEHQYAYDKYRMIHFLIRHQNDFIRLFRGKHRIESFPAMLNNWMFKPEDIMLNALDLNHLTS